MVAKIKFGRFFLNEVPLRIVRSRAAAVRIHGSAHSTAVSGSSAAHSAGPHTFPLSSLHRIAALTALRYIQPVSTATCTVVNIIHESSQ